MALEDQKKNGGMVGEILVSWGYTTEEAIVQALSSQYEFPFILPSTYQADDDTIALIPKEFASRHSIVALDKIGSVLTVAMSNPLDFKAVDELETITRCEIKVFITTFTEIMRTIERHYQVMKPGST
jgi:type IV pilus assembly protein PilB